MKLLILRLASVAVILLTPQAPKIPIGSAVIKIDVLSPAQNIRVTLPEHTVNACTIYASLDEKVGTTDEQYKPRHCWWINPDDHLKGYDDDWAFIPYDHTYDVSVEYQVIKEPFNDWNSFDTFQSNAVRVTHLRFRD